MTEMRNSFGRFFSAALLTLFAVLLTGSQNPVAASPTLLTNDGRTTVELGSGFIGALTSLGISVGTVGEAYLRGTVAVFPINGGGIDLENARGEINHSGGLFLVRGTTRVELVSFAIDTIGSGAVLTGLVIANGTVVGRIPLFNLSLPPLMLPLRLQFFNALVLNPVGLSLTSEAATALNSVFGTSAFVTGFAIGQASVFAVGFPYRSRYYFFF